MAGLSIGLQVGTEIVLERAGVEVAVIRLQRGETQTGVTIVADPSVRVGRRPVTDPAMDEYDHQRLLSWIGRAKRAGWVGAARAAELLAEANPAGPPAA
jgi:hypothetical protein